MPKAFSTTSFDDALLMSMKVFGNTPIHTMKTTSGMSVHISRALTSVSIWFLGLSLVPNMTRWNIHSR